MTRLETAIVNIVEVFQEFAKKDDKKGQLSSEELKDLFKTELSDDFKTKMIPEEVDQAMESMDKNADGAVNFREFSTCIAKVAKSYHRKSRGKGAKAPKP